MIRFGLAVRRYAGKQKDLGSNYASALVRSLEKLPFVDTLVTFPLTMNATLNWLLPLPIFIQLHCGGDSVRWPIVLPVHLPHLLGSLSPPVGQ